MNVFERYESNVRGYCRTWPVVFDKALNAKQWDVDGNEYIDFFSGAGVLNFGHNNLKIRQAMIDYLESGGVTHSLDMYSRSKREFIERFVNVILKPRGLDYKLQFTGPTGTNVVEAALKLARKVTGRRNVVAFTDGFHGMTLGALACTGNQKFHQAAGVELNNVIRVPFDGYLGDGVDTLEPLRRALQDTSSGITPPAAFILETIQAEGGINVASKEWLQQVQQLAREHGSLLIVDDIQASVGRTGHYFSFENLGIEPDLICMAKGIGGYGTPMGVLLIKPELDVWEPGEHTGTFRGQNLSFVAGAAALDYFENDDFLAEVKRKGAITEERLVEMIERANVDIELRGCGMMHGLDMVTGEKAAAVVASAFEQNLIIPTCGPNGRVVKVMPPLTIEDDVLEEGLARLEKAILSL
ncbi:diaminobutyrate--2-oxoglutarate transaminase [Denitrificimonas sp. JX-1]|uniref:Diaminobutyrate--2-oxoglutarate transaminase n=1 Tax=Denitrificimonas halotolerans TaxID=3098930 RepID=A0ABU5GQ16_9GAMM|nr:diaminobutyrate--2-oxoglutarate transaminase [Denitrificimonas sp. JX-1]MDY7219038.1 diaminobutyrate--2-oxoglutarate transaminase [Denitrificimonas sp. JX-1]